LDYPRFATEVQREALDKMERTLAETKKREQAAQAAAKITGKELGELARLRSEKLARRRKAESKKRASESRKGKKKGRKKK
jgi:Arc/MetJ-type ribon-helix-helix transcriptional regulator